MTEATDTRRMVTVKHQDKDYTFLIDPYTKEQVPQLIERVRNGNTKLAAAWAQIRDMPGGDEREKQVENWVEAIQKLGCYCSQLKALDFAECIYIIGSKKMKSCLEEPTCYVCASTVDYWTGEMFKDE